MVLRSGHQHRWLRVSLAALSFSLLWVLLARTEPAYAVRGRGVRADNTGDHSSIQEAVDFLRAEWRANPHETYVIYVYDASPNDAYSEQVVIDYPVSLIGVSGAGGVVVDGGGNRPLTMRGAGIGGDVVISGITFTGGQAQSDGDGQAEPGDRCGGGVLLDEASPTFVNNVVRNNFGSQVNSNLQPPTTWLGGGICLLNSNAILAGNTVVGNGAAGENSGEPGQGGGIFISGGSPVLRGNHIVGNYASDQADGSGGGVALVSSSALLEGNTIAGNAASRCMRQFNFDPEDELRCRNVEGSGGGVDIRQGAPTLSYNTISGNNAGNVISSGGGAVAMTGTRGAVLLGNEIVDNVDVSKDISTSAASDFRSHGLRIDSSTGFRIDSNIIARNRFADTSDDRHDGGGVNIFGASDGLMRHNTIADNGIPGGPGRIIGVQVANGTRLTLANTIFAGHDVAVACANAPCSAAVQLSHTLFDREAAPRAAPAGPWFASNGEIFGDPRFRAPTAPIPDYRILGDSPAKEAGAAVIPAVPGDVDRNARAIGFPDLGAHEFPYSFALSLQTEGVVGPGEAQSFRLSFEVAGNVAAPGATLELTLPPETGPIDPVEGAVISGTTVRWSLGDLSPRQPREVTVTARAPTSPGQTFTAAARISGADGAALTASDVYRVAEPSQGRGEHALFLPTLRR